MAITTSPPNTHIYHHQTDNITTKQLIRPNIGAGDSEREYQHIQ